MPTLAPARIARLPPLRRRPRRQPNQSARRRKTAGFLLAAPSAETTRDKGKASLVEGGDVSRSDAAAVLLQAKLPCLRAIALWMEGSLRAIATIPTLAGLSAACIRSRMPLRAELRLLASKAAR